VAALVDLLNIAKEELNRTNSGLCMVDSKPEAMMAVAAICWLLEDHESARKYVAMHLEWQNENYPGIDLDPSFDTVYRLYGNNHGLPYGKDIEERALHRQEALANGQTHRGDPMMFGLRILLSNISIRFTRDRDQGRLVIAICVALRLCLTLFKDYERDYRETIQLAHDLFEKIASRAGFNARELTGYILAKMNQGQSDFIETLSTVMSEVPSLFGSSYSEQPEILLETPKAGIVKPRLKRASSVTA
jgi:hypothetical protein